MSLNLPKIEDMDNHLKETQIRIEKEVYLDDLIKEDRDIL